MPTGISGAVARNQHTLHGTVVYDVSEFANSFVRLGPAEQEIDANGVGVAGLATITPV